MRTPDEQTRGAARPAQLDERRITGKHLMESLAGLGVSRIDSQAARYLHLMHDRGRTAGGQKPDRIVHRTVQGGEAPVIGHRHHMVSTRSLDDLDQFPGAQGLGCHDRQGTALHEPQEALEPTDRIRQVQDDCLASRYPLAAQSARHRQAPLPESGIVERAMLIDRGWFSGHPDRRLTHEAGDRGR